MSAMRQICTIRDVSYYKSAVYTGDKSDKWFNATFCFYFLLYFGYIFYYIRQRIVKEKICPDAMGKTYLKKQI